MEKHFDIPRRRIKPKRAALVAVFRDSQQLTYGVVTNLSVTGACIVTDSPLAPGSDVDLKLSFYRSPDLYEIGRTVVVHNEQTNRFVGVARRHRLHDCLMFGKLIPLVIADNDRKLPITIRLVVQLRAILKQPL